MSDVNMDTYFRTIKNFRGELAKEQMDSILRFNDDLEILPEQDVFYAKGFFDSVVTDELYFFNGTRMKVVKINLDPERGIVEGLTIEEYRYSQIEDMKLRLLKNYGVELTLHFAGEKPFVFYNLEDSDGNWIENLGRQIRAIYKTINE